MSIAAKLYNRILLNRIRGKIDRLLRKNQQINILRRIIECAEIDQEALFITFVDFKKAFDSIDGDMMLAILRHYGIPESIVTAIRSQDGGRRSWICPTRREEERVWTLTS